MAVAVTPNPSEPRAPKKPDQPLGLYAASAVGAVVVLLGAYLVLRGVPVVWESLAASLNVTDALVRTVVQVVLQTIVAVGLLFLASRLRTGRQPTGVKGGIFLFIAVAFIGFFVGRGFWAVATRGFSIGGVLLLLVYAVIVYLLVQFFRTGRFTDWSVALEQGGWFDAKNYKRTQGQKVRRLTILGILLVCGTGIWTLWAHNYLPENTTVKMADGREMSNRMGDWVIGGRVIQPERGLPPEENRARPRHEGGFTLLPDLRFTVPLILIAGAMWLAWRAVNYPQFADFLVATEAEINKVSWTTRKALFRDTLVVLTSLLLLTLFLFVVDIFWSYLLSRELIGVLPGESDRPAQVQTAEPVKDW